MKARGAGRLAWPLLAFFVALATGGIVLQTLNGNAALEDYLLASAFGIVGTCGAFIAARRPENPIGWLLCAIAFFPALAFVGFEYAFYAAKTNPGSLPGAEWAAWVSNWAWAGLGLLGTFLLLLFPDGRLPSRRWRPVAWGSALAVAAVVFLGAVLPGPIPDLEPLRNPVGLEALSPQTVENALGFAFLAVTAMSVLSAVSMLLRFMRSRGDERQQLKWFTFAAVFTALAVFVGDWLPIPDAVGGIIVLAGLLGIAGATVIAILKYRLYDIDVVINKTVVYGALAAFITAVYVGIVVGVGALVGSGGEPNVALSIVASAVVAVAFQPVRQWVQRFANRLVYGKRASPYEVLARFSERVAGTYATDDVLERTARVVAEGTGAARAEVWLRSGDEFRLAAAWPDRAPDPAPTVPVGPADELPQLAGVDRSVPVHYQGATLGAVTVTKPRGEALAPAEERLLADVAAQVGLALHNSSLTAELRDRVQDVAARAEELRSSRRRIVAAHDDERRRLERNIHDGAQQHLVALAVKMRLAQTLARKSPEKARDLLVEVRGQTRDAIEALRDLSRGIYPPVLEERGIAAALEAQATVAGLQVLVNADGVGRQPIEAEAAVYFCCLEAIQNTAKYAGASTVKVDLGLEQGRLSFAVTDDGGGFDPATVRRGTGLKNMADRIGALGGSLRIDSSPGSGTRVSGWIPVAVLEAVG